MSKHNDLQCYFPPFSSLLQYGDLSPLLYDMMCVHKCTHTLYTDRQTLTYKHTHIKHSSLECIQNYNTNCTGANLYFPKSRNVCTWSVFQNPVTFSISHPHNYCRTPNIDTVKLLVSKRSMFLINTLSIMIYYIIWYKNLISCMYKF